MNCSNRTRARQANSVVPFRGLRYCQHFRGDLADLVSPPYDIVSPAEQELYHSRSEHNAIRLDLGLDLPGDNEEQNRYTRAGELLKQWIAEGILCPEDRPAFYLLQEDYLSASGTPLSRRGFFAAVKLAEFSEGTILPHEETAYGPKQDRLRLMEATAANLSPIFCLYSDPEDEILNSLEGVVAGTPADANIKDDSGTRHRLWVIDAAEALSQATGFFRNKTLLIADGHHRYETALAYRNARRAAENPETEQPYDYLMVYLANLDDRSQQVLPIHRLLCGLKPETVASLPHLLETDFEVEAIGAGSSEARAAEMINQVQEAGRDRNVFGLYLPGSGSFFVITGRRARPMLDQSEGHSDAWRSLDVAVLDQLVLSQIIGIRQGGPNEATRITYVEDTSDALAAASGCDAVFFLNPTGMDQVKAVAEAGEKMPQKSTYFHPKPLTGLVFRSFSY